MFECTYFAIGLNGATKTGAYLALLFHEKSRFIAMPLGGTPFAISE
ncbi:hypothetical protein T4A_9487, partial [Trichinella pseudospiralis]